MGVYNVIIICFIKYSITRILVRCLLFVVINVNLSIYFTKWLLLYNYVCFIELFVYLYTCQICHTFLGHPIWHAITYTEIFFFSVIGGGGDVIRRVSRLFFNFKIVCVWNWLNIYIYVMFDIWLNNEKVFFCVLYTYNFKD